MGLRVLEPCVLARLLQRIRFREVLLTRRLTHRDLTGMRWLVRRVVARDQKSSLSDFWALPARILKSRDASHEFADVAAMTLAIASGGRSKAFGQVSTSAVVTMATAPSTGW